MILVVWIQARPTMIPMLLKTMEVVSIQTAVLTDIWKIARVMVTALPSHGLVMVFATVQMKHMAWICYATTMMGAIVETRVMTMSGPMRVLKIGASMVP